MKQLFLLFISAPLFTYSQGGNSYQDSILQFRQHYKNEFLTDERSPLKEADTSYLRFYEPDARYRVHAKITLTPNAKTFDMPTASGKTKKYKQYGIATFSINDTLVKLQVLQSQKLIMEAQYKDYLFIPFQDFTNYTETYGGGRYIDLSITDIKDGWIEIDFNKCYNPWCAFGTGYSCPIPPAYNKLPIAIKAGEMNFGKEVEH